MELHQLNKEHIIITVDILPSYFALFCLGGLSNSQGRNGFFDGLEE